MSVVVIVALRGYHPTSALKKKRIVLYSLLEKENLQNNFSHYLDSCFGSGTDMVFPSGFVVGAWIAGSVCAAAAERFGMRLK